MAKDNPELQEELDKGSGNKELEEEIKKYNKLVLEGNKQYQKTIELGQMVQELMEDRIERNKPSFSWGTAILFLFLFFLMIGVLF